MKAAQSLIDRQLALIDKQTSVLEAKETLEDEDLRFLETSLRVLISAVKEQKSTDNKTRQTLSKMSLSELLVAKDELNE